MILSLSLSLDRQLLTLLEQRSIALGEFDTGFDHEPIGDSTFELADLLSRRRSGGC